MENRKFLKYASMFVVAMFFASTVVVTAQSNQQQQQSVIMQQQNNNQQSPSLVIIGGITIQCYDEELNMPSIPSGSSSITRAAKAIGVYSFLYNGAIIVVICDRGFNLWAAKLQDGNYHWWHFDGVIKTKAHSYSNWETTPLPLYDTWTKNFPPIGLTLEHREINNFFYQMELIGTVTKDMGPSENIFCHMNGLFSYVDENGIDWDGPDFSFEQQVVNGEQQTIQS